MASGPGLFDGSESLASAAFVCPCQVAAHSRGWEEGGKPVTQEENQEKPRGYPDAGGRGDELGRCQWRTDLCEPALEFGVAMESWDAARRWGPRRRRAR